MKPILLIIAFLLSTLVGFSAEKELIDPEDILGEKELCITDGSSVYIFFPDKKFKLAPIGLSGRTIEGTWTLDSDGLHIKGKWGAVNGLSVNNDYREMDLWIGYLSSKTTTKHFPMAGGERVIHDCYFYINRLEKTKQGEQVAAPNP